MKLSELAKEPRLIKVTINDKDIVKEYGEAIEFWTWDRQPMDIFLKLASLDVTNTANVISAVKDLVLDEAGLPVMKDGVGLPTKVLMRVITRLVEDMGK